MRKLRLLAFLVCLSALSLHLKAQNVETNLKFGKPTDAELKMVSYEQDPDAAAVILCSLTQSYYVVRSNDFKIVTDVSVRVKILKTEGTGYGNVTVPFVDHEGSKLMKEVIHGVKATSYNLENGKVVKTKMTNDMVFRERYDKNTVLLKFTAPQVKVGTVVEYQYSKESDYFTVIDTWYAQQPIPVMYASYQLNIPEYFKFNVAETGFVSAEKKMGREPASFVFGSSPLLCQADCYSFVFRQLPAIKGDRFIWCPKDYCCKVQAEFRKLEIPGQVYKNFTSSWDNIDNELLDDSEFGGCCKRGNPLKKEMVSAGIDKLTDTRDKVVAVYRLLRERLRWNGKYAIWGKSASQVLKEGTANNADFNFILINMLNDVGVKAYPVVMSMRDRGRLPLSHPTIKSLNTFVVGVMENDSVMSFIDASSENGYLNVLPAPLLVEQARVVTVKGQGYWVNLQQLAGATTTVRAALKLENDGSYTGNAKLQYERMASLTAKSEFREAADSAEYVRKMGEQAGVKINEYSEVGRDAFSPKLEEDIVFEGHGDATNDHIYFCPFIFKPVKEALFKEDNRQLPLEFPYNQQVNVSLLITLPDGCSLEEIPQSSSASTEDQGLVYSIKLNPTEHNVAVRVRFAVNKSFFSQSEYASVKTFFETLVGKLSEMVVLKKIQ